MVPALPVHSDHTAAIDDCLPQTQCTRCGYPSCHEYAKAIATQKTSINRCPPGGDATIRKLAKLLGQSFLPLDPSCGQCELPKRAVIIEASCIGCTLCIQACPVDAIVGSSKRMHTVIADECTGCELCVEPCPVDCIQMADAPLLTAETSTIWSGYSSRRVLQARRRFNFRTDRLRQSKTPNVAQQSDKAKIRKEILESVRRTQQKRISQKLPFP